MSEPCLVTVHGPAGLVAAVPSLLGFHPRDSLVLVGLTRERRRCLTRALRVDWPEADPGFLQALAGGAAQWGEDIVLLLYSGPDRLERPLAGEVGTLVRALRRRRVVVLDVLHVGDRVISRHPPDGGPVEEIAPTSADDPSIVALTAALAYEGRRVLSDRVALARSVAGPGSAAARRGALQAFQTAADQVLHDLQTQPQVPDPMIAHAHRITDRATLDVAQRGTVSQGDAATLAVLAADVEVRDRLVGWAVGDLHNRWTAMLVSAVGQLLDPHAVPLLAVLAVAAYRSGDGALANVSIERIFTIDPDHRLAHLLLLAMQAGLPPDRIAELATPTAELTPVRAE